MGPCCWADKDRAYGGHSEGSMLTPNRATPAPAGSRPNAGDITWPSSRQSSQMQAVSACKTIQSGGAMAKESFSVRANKPGSGKSQQPGLCPTVAGRDARMPPAGPAPAGTPQSWVLTPGQIQAGQARALISNRAKRWVDATEVRAAHGLAGAAQNAPAPR